ncbi:unnamed protein product [Polarella glacialis]|uniref:EamA domain-containing protein n=1 Tax=Polarella glacialis TaxID=89957 RepID=A0A813G017_POLGL|nr:unnamed protein product [Polarella glacialis]
MANRSSGLTDWSCGILCIVMVALIWSASSVLVQAIFTSADFARPVFLTWVANSLFMVLLPLRWAGQRLQSLPFFHNPGAGSRSETAEEMLEPSQARGQLPAVSSWGSEIRAGLMVAPIWFAANCMYNIGLSLTSITSSTVISSSSVAFTLLLSMIFLREPLTLLKVLGVVLCWVGNGLTAAGDSPETKLSKNVVWGDVICLLGAMLYAAYTVAIRRLEPKDLVLFFGTLGTSVFVFFSPLVLWLHLANIEPISSLTIPIFGLILVQGLLDNVLSDFFWAKAVLLTSPSVATVGMSLTVPLAMLSDVFMPRKWLVDPQTPGATSILASALVLCGFVLINAAGGSEPGDSCRRRLEIPLISEDAERDAS